MAKLTKESFPNLSMRLKYITCDCNQCGSQRISVGERYMRDQLLSFIRDIQLNLFEVNNG